VLAPPFLVVSSIVRRAHALLAQEITTRGHGARWIF
jgi:hypothetical protein